VTETLEKIHGGDSAPLLEEAVESVESVWDRLLSDLASEVRVSESDWLKSIHEEVVRPLAESILAVSEAARSELGDVDRQREAVSKRIDAWDLIEQYRQRTEEAAVGALARYLRKEVPGKKLRALYQQFLDRLASIAQTLPEEVEIAEAGEALNRRGGEGPLLLLRKAVARKLSSSSLKPVRARDLGRYHLEVRLPRRYDVSREEAQYQVALALVELERTCTEWTHAVLSLEASLDASVGLVEPDIKELSEGPEEELAEANSVPSELKKVDYLDVLEEVSLAGGRFVERLEGVAQALQDWSSPEERNGLPHLHAFLDYDVKAAGTFLLAQKSRTVPEPRYLSKTFASERDEVWIRYQTESTNRIRLNQHLLRIRSALIQSFDSIIDQVRSATVVPLKDIYSRIVEGIQEERFELERLFDEAEAETEPTTLLDQLRDISHRAAEGVQAVTVELGGVNAADEALRNLGADQWSNLRRRISELPAKLEIHGIDLEGAPRIDLDTKRTAVNLTSITAEVSRLRFAERLRKPAQNLRRVVARRWGDAAAAGDMIAFGADAAFDVITEKEGDAWFKEARELMLDGLDRTVERTEDALQSLDRTWYEFSNAAVRIIMELWRHVHQRVRSEELEMEQWAGIGSRFSVLSRSYWISLQREWTRFEDRFAVWRRLGSRKAGVLIRKGRSVVGATGDLVSDATATIDSLHAVQILRKGMPLVYQKLFSLEPLRDVDASLMENRRSDLDAVKLHFERWGRADYGKILIISSEPGGGRTSFLNALGKLLFAETDLFSVTFDKRRRDEGEVASLIAESMGLKFGGPPSFESLKRAIDEIEIGERPVVCRLFDLESVMLAIPNGVELINDLLVVLSRTDQKVFWVGGISELGRQFIERTASSSGLVQFRQLTAFDGPALEALIMNRHRRSGVDIEFETPPSPSTLMKQKLKRAPSDEDRQVIVQNAFLSAWRDIPVRIWV
jgi:hypothetical protein